MNERICLYCFKAATTYSHVYHFYCRMRNLSLDADGSPAQHKPSFRRMAELKIATFKATKSMCKFNLTFFYLFIWPEIIVSKYCSSTNGFIHIDGKTILAFLTLYSVAVFSLDLSWNLTTAEISDSMINALEIMTVLLHAIFFLCSFFMWVTLQLFESIDYFLINETWLTGIFLLTTHFTSQLERGRSPTIFGCSYFDHLAICGLALQSTKLSQYRAGHHFVAFEWIHYLSLLPEDIGYRVWGWAYSKGDCRTYVLLTLVVYCWFFEPA